MIKMIAKGCILFGCRSMNEDMFRKITKANPAVGLLFALGRYFFNYHPFSAV
jgi:hypothetical protein